MKKHFLDYELSLEFKEIGFLEDGFGLYREGDLEILSGWYNNSFIRRYPDTDKICVALITQQAFRFIRERYGKTALIFSDGFQWSYDLRWADPDANFEDPYPGIMFPKKESDREMFDTYEEAEIKAIKKLIEVIKEEK